ncbi:hypothetical protein M422DRAFT_176923 [Sphaerobolus stellatus SS14]|uniref:PBP domain-containing protein n=1 Tax=Sphaerobolus stellatus (strain SS14) TaxID=990650 RepID=A0A0C9VKW2_SPHS4|nr:hypothetical protein M422DRAFT_176923 [Sphaerobolus stellatus SS14]
MAGSQLLPQEVYNGSHPVVGQQIKLKIGNGGAGQSGLIGEWANAFIDYCTQEKKMESFSVGWYLCDTTQSLAFLSEGSIDIAVTYNTAAEQQKIDSGDAVQSIYGFRDHFYLVGPKSNPAGLTERDSVLDMFNNFVALGNRDDMTPPTDKPPVRFLSRYDKSATNIKESELFITIGQVPWALAYSKWYHQYPRFPLQALSAAAVLEEYTLTDHGTWLSSPKNVVSQLEIYKQGSDMDPNDRLLNPAHVLLGKASQNDVISKLFMQWVVDPSGGQKIIENFRKNGEVLYSKAPGA